MLLFINSNMHTVNSRILEAYLALKVSEQKLMLHCFCLCFSPCTNFAVLLWVLGRDQYFCLHNLTA